MLEIEFLKKLAVKNQIPEIDIYREYCQHLFLSYFYKYPTSQGYLFKGGTALRIIFESPRYSEDLDFSAASVAGIEDLLLKTLQGLDGEGLKIDKIPSSEPTSGGYISFLDFSAPGFSSRIKLNVQLKDQAALGAQSKLINNEFVPPYLITYLREEILIAEKIQAFLTREFAKERDFFDLYFILGDARLRNFARSAGVTKDQILERLKALSDSELKAGLKDLLPISYHNLFLGANFKTQIERLISANF